MSAFGVPAQAMLCANGTVTQHPVIPVIFGDATASGAALAFLISGAYNFSTLGGMARMSTFSSRLGLVFVLAALCLGGRTAHAQAAPVTYLIPSWPVGFG